MENKKLLYIILTISLVIVLGIIFLIDKKGNHDYDLEPSKPVETSKGYGVSASHPLAVKAGMEILEAGGNAVDAAIAVSYALGVVELYGSGIGGGGEMIVYSPDKKPMVYDYREKAPLSGNQSGDTGVPGLVKGLESVHAELGSMDMEDLLQPAIDLAGKGFKVDPLLTARLQAASYRINTNRVPHLFPDGVAIQPGEILVQEELEKTLKKIQKKGSDAIYNSEITTDIINSSSNLSRADFKNYSFLKTEPAVGEFVGFKVYSAPPPLSGITTTQSLQMADKLQDYLSEDNSVTFVHVLNEITKVAYQDRLGNIADPAFFNRSFAHLTTSNYTDTLLNRVSFNSISNQADIDDSKSDEEDHSNTTHFVVVDKNGMMVSATHTLSNFFGSGVYVDGFFLNNQLNNFSYSSKSPNLFRPGKKTRSYTSPMILISEDRVIGIGSPGGKRIPMVLSQVLVRHLLLNQPLQEAINAPRFYVEDHSLFVEESFNRDVINKLENKGYNVYYRESTNFFGGVQAIVVDKENDKVYGAADSRRNGYWLVGRDEE